MIIGFLNLDFAVATRIYLKAEFQYEGIFATRQLYVIANEGYKQIFGFGNKRQTSMWVAEIGKIIDVDFPKLKLDYQAITSRLEGYESIISSFRVIRDYSIHYDAQPMEVYNMMIKLDTEIAFQEIMPFMNIISDMYRLVSDLFKMDFEQIITGNEKFTRVFEKINRQIEEYKIALSDHSSKEGLNEV